MLPRLIPLIGKAPVAAAIAVLLCAGTVSAQGPHTPNLRFNGFGTLGVVYSDEDEADFASVYFAREGAGHSNRWSAKVDSRLAVQATAEYTPRLTGVLQLVTEQRYDGTFTPTVEWLNLNYDVTPELSIRGGRMVQPSWMLSEYTKVGYANHWVRPPSEVYGMIPATYSDGVTARHAARVGDFLNTLTLHATSGRVDGKVPPDGTTFSVRDAFVVTNALERGSTTVFAGYTTHRLTIDDVNEFFDGFRQFGPEGEDIADRYDVDNKRFEMFNVGLRHDPGDWFVLGEWAQAESRTFIGDKRAWYLSGGYRHGAFTPYVIVARARVLTDTSDPGLSGPGTDDPNATLNEFLASGPQQKSIAVGTRWDFARGAALKVQYDYLDLDDGSAGVLVNEQPDFERGGTVSLFSIALDFVF